MRKKGPSKILLDKEMRFVAAFQGDHRAAMEAAGFKWTKQLQYRLMKVKRVQEALTRKQEAATREAGKKFGRVIAKHEIIERVLKAIDRLDAIAEKVKNKKDALGVQAKALDSLTNALDALAVLTNNKVSLSADLTKEFKGRSEDDMEFFAVNGYWPEAADVDRSESGANLSESSGADTKPN